MSSSCPSSSPPVKNVLISPPEVLLGEFTKFLRDFINDSTSINLRVDVCKPADATVSFYYKVKELGETEILSEQEFIKFTNVTVPTSLSGEFYEVEKQIDNLSPFNALVFKVVFETTNTAQVPKIKNLRLIALA